MCLLSLVLVTQADAFFAPIFRLSVVNGASRAQVQSGRPLPSLRASDKSDIPPQLTAPHPMKIAFQGEAGAYSEKAARELLGPRIVTMLSSLLRTRSRLCE